MLNLKEIVESILCICKIKKNTTLLSLLFFICGCYSVYQFMITKCTSVEGLHILMVILFLQAIVAIICITMFSYVYENKSMFTKLEMALVGNSGNAIELLNALSNSFQSNITQTDNIIKLCTDINNNIKNAPEIKSNLDMIRLRSQNVVFKCMKVLVNYNRDYASQLAAGLSSEEARLFSLQNANDSLKTMKKIFIDELYESCTNLSSFVKDDINQYIDEQNIKIKEILDSNKYNCEEKVSCILMMNSSLSDSIFALCRRHLAVLPSYVKGND